MTELCREKPPRARLGGGQDAGEVSFSVRKPAMAARLVSVVMMMPLARSFLETERRFESSIQ
jgi:hypothetical protein